MAKKSALVIGIIFVLVGILGFVNNPVIGLFNVNALHNIVHIIFGLILLAAARGAGAAATLKWVGIIYLILAIIGFIWGISIIGVASGGDADNWLHLVLGIVIAALGFSGSKSSMSMPSAPQM